MNFKVDKKNSGQRLDKFLTQKLKDLSRSQIQKQIRAGLVLVNRKIKPVHYFLKEKDELETGNWKLETGTKKKFKIKIVKQTDDCLVVEKPAGLVVHPAPGVKEKTLIEFLIEKYPEIKNIKDGPWPKHTERGSASFLQKQNLRPGIAHRLDKETSGLMVVARSQKMFECLKKQFQSRQIKKNYQALVEGIIEKDEGKIITPLKKNKQNIMIVCSDQKENVETSHLLRQSFGKMGGMVGGRVGEASHYVSIKDAVTEFKVLKRFQHYTLLELTIKTGRTHQIRAHLKSIGHPVVGDQLYNTSTHKREIIKRRERDRQNLGRIFLHAGELGFYDLENKPLTFQQSSAHQILVRDKIKPRGKDLHNTHSSRQAAKYSGEVGSKWLTFKSPLPQKLKNFLKTLR